MSVAAGAPVRPEENGTTEMRPVRALKKTNAKRTPPTRVSIQQEAFTYAAMKNKAETLHDETIDNTYSK